METTISTSTESYTANDVRHYALPYALLLKSLTFRMQLRLRRAEHLVARARSADQDEAIFAWLTAASVVWTLVENVLKLYRTIAMHPDIRSAEALRNLHRGFLSDLPDDDRIDFHKRIWLFAAFDQIPDTAFEQIGIGAASARQIINNLTERSINYLTSAEDAMRDFYRKYSDVMNAFKHGRALLALQPEIKRDEHRADVTNLTLNASRLALTTFIAADGPMFGTPRRMVTITADAELIADVERTLGLLAIQVPRLADFFGAWAEATARYLAGDEGDATVQRPTIPFSFFADPYSTEEEQLLRSLRERPLVF